MTHESSADAPKNVLLVGVYRDLRAGVDELELVADTLQSGLETRDQALPIFEPSKASTGAGSVCVQRESAADTALRGVLVRKASADSGGEP